MRSPVDLTAKVHLMTTATFVMPLFNDRPRSLEHARAAIESVLAQSDPDWRLIIVDDCSPVPPEHSDGYLAEFAALAPGRIVGVRNDENRGQGVCRNIGIELAHRHHSPIVLFLDADDLAHPRRLEVTREVFRTTDANFVYSGFGVIDESGNRFATPELTPSIAEILEEIEHNRIEGRECWIPIATRTGYLTLTSTVAVRTELAVDHPFPEERGSEDFHAFLRMAAGGALFSYQADIPAQYRVNRTSGSSDRSRWGREEYYAAKLRGDSDGFEKACALALARGTVTESEITDLRKQFRTRLAETIRGEGFGHLLENFCS